jgi:sensor histidine kinase YesM
VTIKLPPGVDSQAVKEAVDEARRDLLAALEEAKQEAADAAEAAADARHPRVVRHRYGDPLMPLTMWFILFSIIVKASYKGKVQAEAKAAQATEVAESESLKRQVVEARMAAMQAQVEPHFLFNTLASIEHLIETDPARAGKMQRNLIALLRASMPTMREANAQGTRDLGRELAMIRPYLEILKVRMEDRLQTEVRVSDGLLSAEFPPMMLQSLVENAIKHGLEPKAEGGLLTVSAEIVHGNLAVTVADSGLGFGKSDTAGTGIGLSNIRERLALLYGGKASLTVTEPAAGGTSATITLPYAARASTET